MPLSATPPDLCRTRSQRANAGLWENASADKWEDDTFERVPSTGKLRTLVNAVKFVSALSRKGGRASNGVRNAGVCKPTNKASSSSPGTPLRPLHASRSKKEPTPLDSIPFASGCVETLLEHCVGVTGVKYLARCETKNEWLTEGALIQRPDGVAALNEYRDVMRPSHPRSSHRAPRMTLGPFRVPDCLPAHTLVTHRAGSAQLRDAPGERLRCPSGSLGCCSAQPEPSPTLEVTQEHISSQSPIDATRFWRHLYGSWLKHGRFQNSPLAQETINLPLGCLQGG